MPATEGNDELFDTSGDDTIDALGGDDRITVTAGADQVAGSAGADTLVIDYAGTGSVVTGATLSWGTLEDGYNGRIDYGNNWVSYSGIEHFVITAAAAVANIQTGRGNDTIVVGSGSRVAPSGGNDYVEAAGSGNTIDYSQRHIDREAGTVGVVVNLSAAAYVVGAGHVLSGTSVASGQAIDNWGGFDTIVGFDRAETGDQDDVLLGSDVQNIFYAWGGNDTIVGGAGWDYVNAGDGSDTIDYSAESGTRGVIVNLEGSGVYYSGGGYPFSIGPGEARDSFGDLDTLLSVENVTTGDHKDLVIGNASSNRLELGAGNDIARGYGGNDILIGGDGNDELDGGTGEDRLEGGAGDDYLIVDYQYAQIDEVLGGSGTDILYARFNNSEAAVVFGPDRTASAAGGYDGFFLTANGVPAVTFSSIERFYIAGSIFDDQMRGADGDDVLLGGGGNDIMEGHGGADLLNGHGGADTMTGGAGDDTYVVESAGDQVIEAAGEGTDLVRVSATLAVYVLPEHVENLNFLGTATAATDIRGNGANNVIDGTAMNDFFRLQDGGEEDVEGFNGNDVFYMGAALSAGDLLQGGNGADQVAIQGDYSAGLTLGAGNLVGSETLALLSGSDARFGDTAGATYDYTLTAVDANVGAGAQLTIDAAQLAAGEDLIFNGSAETDGSFYIFAGKGTDTLMGGAQLDVFLFRDGGRFTADDRVDGGGGIDQLALRGDYSTRITMQADTITDIEVLAILSGNNDWYGPNAGNFSYNLLMHDGNVLAGETLMVDAAQLRAGETLILDGSLETDGAFKMWGGLGNDVLIGGAGADTLTGGGGADTLAGNGGDDVFRYRSAGDSTADVRDTIISFFAGDKIDLSAIDADGVAANGNGSFAFVGAAAFSGTAGELRAFEDSNAPGTWRVEADLNGDGISDLVIDVIAANGHALTTADFFL